MKKSTKTIKMELVSRLGPEESNNRNAKKKKKKAQVRGK